MDVIVITGISLGGIAFIAGIILFISSRKFAVKENPMIDNVEELLPGANCGGCGYAGCRAFAEDLVNQKNTEIRCPVAGAETMKAIAEMLGLKVDVSVRNVARIMCQGGAHSLHEGKYLGINACSAAVIGNTVDLVCPSGCLGYGDCAQACPFDSIRMIRGLAVVDEDTCTGCGICIKTCPRQLIELVPYHKRVYVACKSADKGADVKKYCSVGCIGCKLCEKACQFDAIEYKPFISRINPDKCTECMACVEKCPTKTILFRD
ncbi:RnfABCDGE type electron transport complex subunit B, partial [bacterium]|nr:RnfABCDGE type electron transport complex subunit B [candidate division CSSED10-310 bacterium]